MIAKVPHMTNVGIEELPDARLEQLLQAHDFDVSQVAASVSKYIVPGQEAIVVKNTFLDVEEAEAKPSLRRNRSFSEFGAHRTKANPSDDAVHIDESASTVSCDGSLADSCELSVCSGAEGDHVTPARRGKGTVGEAAAKVQRTATRSTETGDESFVDSCESCDDQWVGSTVQSRTFPVFQLGSRFHRTKQCDDSFVDSCESSSDEDAIPCEEKALSFLPAAASRRTEFDDAQCFVDSCDESVWSDAENTIPVPQWPTFQQRETRRPPSVWNPKPKMSGKRRKSGWTRQRRSRAIAEEAKIETSADKFSTSLTVPTNTTSAPLNYPGYFSNMCAAYVVPVCVATPISNLAQSAFF
jgi:hypothetical protein